MELIIGIVVGIIIGLVVGTLIFWRRYIPVGDLRIDRSDPTDEEVDAMLTEVFGAQATV